MEDNQAATLSEEERREHLEHTRMLDHIRKVMGDRDGLAFIKYLLESFNVGELPELGLEGNILYDQLGFLRAGTSIFKIISEADPGMAGKILAEIERGRYERQFNRRYEE